MGDLLSRSVDTLELFSGIGGMSLGLHSEGFKTHGFDASERAVAMANENGLASTVADVFDPEIVEAMRRVQPNPVLIHASPPCKGYSQASASTQDQKQMWNSLTTRAAGIMLVVAHPEAAIRVYGAIKFRGAKLHGDGEAGSKTL